VKTLIFAPVGYLLLTMAFISAPSETWAANHYVRQGASGAGSGSDWTNGYTSLPSTLVRGDTYYIADGSYGSYIFNTPDSGTTLIVIKKAIAVDHGTDTGWNASTMGSGTATFTATGTVWNIQQDYLTIDGQTGTANGAHGFRFNSSSTTDGSGAIVVSAKGANVTYRHIEANNAPALNSNGSRVFDSVSTTSNNNTFQYVYFHGGRVWLSFTAGGTSNQLVEYSYFADAGSGDPSLHSAGFTLADMTNFTLRYSVLENMLGGSNTTYIEPQFTSNIINIYGNIIKATASNELTGQGILAITSTDVATDVRIYNNVVYGLHNFSGVWCGNVAGSVVHIYNNVWENTVDPSFQMCSDVGINVLNTGVVNFMDAPAGNFHLSAPTTSGVSLASPYNIDPDGNTRGAGGVWDQGAYQYVTNSANLPAPPQNLRITVQ
jgi:hypothetical protein